MQDDKGHCKHGEFFLNEGCSKCVEERRKVGIRLEPELEPDPELIGEQLAKEVGISLPVAETALITSPGADAEVISYYNEALKLQQYAESRVIVTTEDLKPATDDLSIIARLKKALEEKRKEYVKPLQDHVKEINDAFKTFMAPIEVADTVTREKILAFQLKQKLIREEQEEINRLRLEAAQKEMALKGEITESVDLIELSPEAPKRIYTELGTTGQRMIRKWELINMAEVPEEYKTLDTTKITKVVKAGIPSIPGIRIYAEPIITVSAR